MSAALTPDVNNANHANNAKQQAQNRTQPHSKQVVEQFAGMMKQKQSYVDKDHKERVDELSESEKAEISTDDRKIHSGRERSSIDDEPSVPKTISHIQRQLTRLSRVHGQKSAAKRLHEKAQESVDQLKEQGYKVQDLKLPEDDDTQSVSSDLI